VDEHVIAAIIANDEAEALLRVEEFDDALAFADDLRRHPAATATTKAAATATAAEASATAAVAAAITVAASAAASAIAAASAAAVAAAFLETAKIAAEILFAETIALITTATAAVTFAPSIETHNRPNLICPLTPETNALGQKGATGHGA
jgi:hypothetical protein